MQVRDDVGIARDVLVLQKSAEGYATVVTLCDRKDPSRGYNRVPSQRDYEAVTLAASQIAAAFLRLGMFPALELLGNSSHHFIRGSEDRPGYMQIGNDEEPFKPHIHVIGRGDPSHAYISGVPLRGKPPYEVMIPRQRSEKFANEGEREAVAAGLAASLEAVELHP